MLRYAVLSLMKVVFSSMKIPPFYTYCGSGDRACLYASTGNIQSLAIHACTGHLLFSLAQNSVRS
jgi:hypothetical protein